MIDEEVAETVEQLEGQHAVLRGRIARAVQLASAGQSDGGAIPELTRDAAALSGRIEAARAERDRAENARRRMDQEQVRHDLPQALTMAAEHRAAFLSHYRAACVALGSYLEWQAKATALTNATATNFGVMPADAAALRGLDLGDAPTLVLNGLRPDMDSGWKMTFPVTPMYEK